jgi:hypothetical protein
MPGVAAEVAAFIADWGNFIIDQAVLGASLSRTMFSQNDTSPTVRQKVKDARGFGDMLTLLQNQVLLFAVQDSPVEASVNYRFEMSRAFRLGQFYSSPMGSGDPTLDRCAIGTAIVPQARPCSSSPSRATGRRGC